MTADRPVGTWQASGSTLLGLGNPATFTADARGRVTFATPAVELDAPQLSVQIVSDDSGDDASSAVAVSPDADVHAFLAGAAPLNDLGTLTGGSLLAATRADGNPLFPVLANVPADQQAQRPPEWSVRSPSASRPGRASCRARMTSSRSSWTCPGTCPPTPAPPAGRRATPLVGADRLGSLSELVGQRPERRRFLLPRRAARRRPDRHLHGELGRGRGRRRLAVGGEPGRHDRRRHRGDSHYVITDIKSAIHAVTGFFPSSAPTSATRSPGCGRTSAS